MGFTKGYSRGARIVGSYAETDLYENMEKNTIQFAEKEIVDLIANTHYSNKETKADLNFHLIFCGDFEDLIIQIKTDENLKKYEVALMKAIFSVGHLRHLALLTPIDDEFYDIANSEFVDLKRNKIIHYDNLTLLYNDSNARIKYFTKEEEPQLPHNMVLLDIDDESIIKGYEDKYINQEDSEDFTKQFIDEVNGKAYTLKK